MIDYHRLYVQNKLAGELGETVGQTRVYKGVYKRYNEYERNLRIPSKQ